MLQRSPTNTSGIAAALADTLEQGDWKSKARANQLPPDDDVWSTWLILAGRGFGKTRAGSEWIKSLVENNAAGRIALVAPKTSDARDIMLEGDSGIMTISPDWNRPLYEPSKRRLTWNNGAVATLFSAEEVEQLRGFNHDTAWCDELGSWPKPQEVWDQLQFTMRRGKHPRTLVTTTPKPIGLIKDLVKRDGQDVRVVRGSTFDNSANLSDAFLTSVRARYEGTRLGRQELYADVLSDVDGAMWSMDWIDANRAKSLPWDGFARVVVAIDPAVTSGENADETGIVVAALDHVGHGWILADLSGKYGPHEWAQIAIKAYRDHNADRIIAEKNNGGDMVEATIRSVDPNVSFKAVTATRGKAVRAEPISALYEQGKIHHIGTFTKLEDQLCAFTADFSRSTAGYSPDRLDALVWALTELMLERTRPKLIFV